MLIVGETVGDSGGYIYAVVGLVAVLYALLVIYLAGYLLITLGFEKLVDYKWVQKIYNVEDYLEEKKQLQEKSNQK